jgi:hypothetical protein
MLSKFLMPVQMLDPRPYFVDGSMVPYIWRYTFETIGAPRTVMSECPGW